MQMKCVWKKIVFEWLKNHGKHPKTRLSPHLSHQRQLWSFTYTWSPSVTLFFCSAFLIRILLPPKLKKKSSVPRILLNRLLLGKQLVNFITWGCESSAPFLWFTKLGANPRHIGDRLVWVVRSNDLTHWYRYINVKCIYILRGNYRDS
jgi:hypothetical protein